MMQAYQKTGLPSLLLCLGLLNGCQKPATATQNASPSEVQTQSPALPPWLTRQIEDFKQAKPANPPVKIYRYLYRNEPVYYISRRCCDIPGALFTVEGQQLCQPDGGITGKGDGKCPDFFTTRTQEELVWEDLRN